MSHMGRLFPPAALLMLVVGFALGFLSANLAGLITLRPETVTQVSTSVTTSITTTTFIETKTTTLTTKTTVALEVPTFVFYNGQVVTMESDIALAEAIAIKGQKIIALGSNKEILALATSETRVINLEGMALLPGFVEGHTHILRFPHRREKTIDEAMALALSYGLTTVNEMAADKPFLDKLMEAEQQGRLRLRVNVYPEYNAGILDSNGKTITMQVWFPGHGPILELEHRLRVPGIKIFVDGAFSPGRGCPALTAPYPADFQSTPSFKAICLSERGDLYLPQEEVNKVVAAAQAAEFRVAFHAFGDRGIETALNALEQALKGESNERYRHQIHHNSLLRPDQLTRYANLKILASVRGYFNTCDQDSYQEGYGLERFEWAANRFALPGLGVHAFAEGDFGWTTDPSDRTSPRPINPLLTLYGLVTHKQLKSDGTSCDPKPWIARHKISVEQALRMLTIEPAYASSQENVIGSLKPGKFADLVVLSKNPLTVDPEQIKDIKVLVTMVNGRIEYCGPGHEALCPSFRSHGEGSALIGLMGNRTGNLENSLASLVSRKRSELGLQVSFLRNVNDKELAY